tara:strand:+ start:2262 stop:2546 length:285 start_codon:yes stop_codon:yes gene_type:complete
MDVRRIDFFMLGFILTRLAVTLELQAHAGWHEVDPEFRKTLSKAVDIALDWHHVMLDKQNRHDFAMSIISAQPSSFFEVPLGKNGELNVQSRNK